MTKKKYRHYSQDFKRHALKRAISGVDLKVLPAFWLAQVSRLRDQ